jgi:hypothetical protein
MVVDIALLEREASGRPIRVGMVGASATGSLSLCSLQLQYPAFASWRAGCRSHLDSTPGRSKSYEGWLAFQKGFRMSARKRFGRNRGLAAREEGCRHA